MKNTFRSALFIALFILLGAPNIYFNIRVPAAVNVPDNIKTVAIIDRSHSENEAINIIEKGLMSALSGKADRLSGHCIEGVYNQIVTQNKINPVITGLVEKRKGSAIDFPAPMHWLEVEEICSFNSKMD